METVMHEILFTLPLGNLGGNWLKVLTQHPWVCQGPRGSGKVEQTRARRGDGQRLSSWLLC